MNYIQLLRSYARYLAFSISHSFFSGYGQTFFIAFFIPQFRDAFQVGILEFSALYSVATLTSAFLLPFFGKKIDDYNLRNYAASNGIFLCSAGLIIAAAPNIYVLFLGLVCLRLSAQSLMSHIASTAMARYFGNLRGKALGLSSLGHPLGEAILPFLAAQILTQTNFRGAWAFLILLFALLYFPLNRFLVRGDEPFVQPPKKKKVSDGDNMSMNRRDVLTTSYFYFVIPLAIMPPFLATGFLLHQADMASIKGWEMTWMASCLVGFALFRIVGSFLVGPVIDRFSARKIYPFHLAPLILGLILFSLSDNPFSGFAFFSLMGFSIGLETNIKSAMWAEVYGTDHLGAIRSMALTVMIFSTGLSPVLFGWLIEGNLGLDAVAIMSAGLVVLTSILSGFAPLPQKKKS